jgi:hypothetical protein
MSNIHRQPEIDPLNTKYIVKTTAISHPSQIWIHWIFRPNTIQPIKRGKKIRIANQLVRINHYVCQSEEFFNKVKSVRGDANSPDTKWTKDYFDLHNNKATLVDETLKNIVLNPPANY